MQAALKQLTIIPFPQKLQIYNYNFSLQNLVINIEKQFIQIVEQLQTFLQSQNIKININNQITKEQSQESNEVSKNIDNNTIQFKIFNPSNNEIQNEGYILAISINTIDIQANTLNGLFYGVQTLKQIIITRTDQNQISCLKIIDYPRYEWRGMHLDVSRHFMPKDFIIKYIDYLALYKLNRFHWHLTDDQGWRIEIKKYPNLTLIGSKRSKSEIGFTGLRGGFQQKKYDNKEHSGFYTQDEIKEIVKYAEKNFIMIIPEIDGPGHLQAAIASYPELGCTQQKVDVMCHWGISQDLLNLKETSFQFMEDVFREVADLFPGKYVHIGGDEVELKAWQNLQYSQEFMKEKGLTEYTQIQDYYNQRIQKLLHSKGKIIVGWDEILYNQGKTETDKIIMIWRGEQHAIEAAKQQLKYIISSQRQFYFDIQESKDKDYPMARQAMKRYGLPNLKKIYQYEPEKYFKDKSQANYILGIQGQVWTEHMQTPKDVEFKIFPRLLALAEIAWIDENKKQTYESFKDRVKVMSKYFDKNNISYCKAFLTE